MTGKPALVSIKDCVNMGIIKINADNVYSLYFGHMNQAVNAKRYREEADKI